MRRSGGSAVGKSRRLVEQLSGLVAARCEPLAVCVDSLVLAVEVSETERVDVEPVGLYMPMVSSP